MEVNRSYNPVTLPSVICTTKGKSTIPAWPAEISLPRKVSGLRFDAEYSPSTKNESGLSPAATLTSSLLYSLLNFWLEDKFIASLG